jgi:transcription factor SFP1
LEADYCRDFSCCGLVLNDLHDLLQHYEESHVQFEGDDEEENSDNNVDDDRWSATTPPLSPTFDHGPAGMTMPVLDSMKQKAASYLSDMYNHGGPQQQWAMANYDSELDSLTATSPGFSDSDSSSMPPTPISEYYPPFLPNVVTGTDGLDDDEAGDRVCGKKRTFQQASSTNAMDLLTLSAAKKLAMTTGDSLNGLTDEEFLAHAGVLLASANTSCKSSSYHSSE